MNSIYCARVFIFTFDNIKTKVNKSVITNFFWPFPVPYTHIYVIILCQNSDNYLLSLAVISRLYASKDLIAHKDKPTKTKEKEKRN